MQLSMYCVNTYWVVSHDDVMIAMHVDDNPGLFVLSTQRRRLYLKLVLLISDRTTIQWFTYEKMASHC